MSTTHGTATTAPRGTSRTLRAAWYYILPATLILGGWSMYHVLHARVGVPALIAAGAALLFDGAALVLSEYARAAIERGRGFTIPALGLLGAVAASAFINHAHGAEQWGSVGGLVLGAVPVVLEVLFLAHVLDARMAALHTSGLLPERLPRVGVLGFLLFPGRSFRAVRAVVGRRLDAIEAGAPVVHVTVQRVDAPATPVDAAPTTPTALPTPADATPLIASTPPTPQVTAVDTTPAPEPVAPVETPAPAPAPTYDDARIATIRSLYNSGYRPQTDDMIAALEAAGHKPVTGSTVRTWRTTIEAVEPQLKRLPTRIAS